MIKEAAEERAKRPAVVTQKQNTSYLNKSRMILTGAFILFFYIIPIYVVPNSYEIYDRLIISQANKE